ncbi:hypothetical protein [Tunturiibacter lichenicola]|uniref:hypothetical protein n=1 Tax=Tunturiibacter lichenicola TaxID=2051959 RepID=UPI003D9ABDC4
MALSFSTRIFATAILAAALPVAAIAQTPAPNTTEWENEGLALRLFYPSDLVKADPEKVMHNGRLTLLGVSGAPDPKLAEATRCLRPRLVLDLSQSGQAQTSKTQPTADGGTQVTITPAVTATILLAELDIDCMNSEHPNTSTTLLPDMAELVNKVPGMKSIVQPAWYNVGWQKVHMAAAQGQPSNSDPASAQPAMPQTLYTMGLSTNWNNHLLVWYFSSNNIDTLNRITKTTVRFGRAQAAPLYPNPMGTAAP